jgi:glycosyltransferase involved in cell wall biosynthesis
MNIQKNKLKILMCSEASFLKSGYGTYAKEILSRLHKSNKYIIAEFASYGMVNDPGDKEIDWIYYANAVKATDPRYQEYMSRADNQFGRWRFEKVLLDFKPDIVVDVRDYWMSSYQAVSPLRKFFHWIPMPTVDSEPQQELWIDTFLSADAIFTYSDWGADVLKRQSSNKINYIDTTSPGVDLDVFKIKYNKEEIKNKLNIPKDSIILGSVMRNQKRKLIPELFMTFRQILDTLSMEDPKLGSNLFLYLHTSYPDMGWDIPELLKDNRLSNKVLFTYSCKNCKNVNTSVFKGPQKVCSKCFHKASTFTSVSDGVTSETLSDIYNTFDMYVQYAICLGENENIKIKRDNNILWLPISQVKVGDKAWTHQHRWKNISKVWKNLPKSYNKKVMEISICSDYETLLATQNHEFPAYTSNELKIKHKSIRENIGYYLSNNRDLPSYGKYQLDELKPGDILLYPIDDTTKDSEIIDIAKEIDCSDYIVLDSFIETSKKYSYPRHININNDFCKFMGLFAADGTWNFNKTYTEIKITSNKKETNNQSLAKNIFKGLSSDNNTVSTRNYKERFAIDNILCSKLHSQLFAKWFGKHDNKQLPDWTMQLPLSKQKYILQGLFMGDGHFMETNNTSVYCTISEILASQIKNILRRLRIQFNIRIDHKEGNRKPQYRFEVPGNIKEGIFLQNSRKNSKNVYYKNYHLLQIKKIQDSSYDRDTWCVTVDDDHTMTTKLGATFQCEGFGMPQVEAGACGVPIITVNYSAMCDIVKKLNAFAVEPKSRFKELETKAIRVYPDNQQLHDHVISFLSLPQPMRMSKGLEVRKLTEHHYNWDNIAKKWENYFDKLDNENFRSDWNSSVSLLTPIPNSTNISIQPNQNFELMTNLYQNYIGNISDIENMMSLDMLRDADYGFSIMGNQVKPFSYKNIVQYLETIISNNNIAEEARSKKIEIQEDFIHYAHMKAQS